MNGWSHQHKPVDIVRLKNQSSGNRDMSAARAWCAGIVFFYQIFQLLTIRCAERMWPTGNLETFCVFQINLTRFYASTVVVSASRIWLVKEAGELCRDDFVLTCCPQFLCCDLYNEADMCPPWTAIRKVTWECWHCVDSCHMECSRGAKVLTLWSVARQYQGWFSHSRVECSYISTPG